MKAENRPDTLVELEAGSYWDAMEDKSRMDFLIEQAGHFQDDSFTAISFHGDDATRTWHLTLGSIKAYGHSIREAIDSARSKYS